MTWRLGSKGTTCNPQKWAGQTKLLQVHFGLAGALARVDVRQLLAWLEWVLSHQFLAATPPLSMQ